MVLDKTNGVAGEKVVVSVCITSDPVLLKDTIEKHSYIPVKMGKGGTVQF
jgi:hypothetical protein